MSPRITPLDAACLTADARWQAWIPRLVWSFVALGVAIRLVGYLLCFPLWIDECLLAENLLDRSFLDLALPLENNQVAPVGFLWVELAVVRLFGFSEWSLRLFPLVCGIGSLFVFRHLASRLLAGLPLVFAVGCLAVAKAPVGLSANVKPYATDLFVAVVLVTMAVEWLRRPERTIWMWILAVAMPVALSLSYPAVFVGGAVGLGLLLPVIRRRRCHTWIAYTSCNILLCSTFAGILTLTSGPEFAPTRVFMHDYWTPLGGFPPMTPPVRLVGWLIDVHLGDRIFAVPYGAENGGGFVPLVCCALAAFIMFRRGQRPVLAIFAATFGLAFVAGALQRYPYGGHNRLMQFLIPAICIGSGLGLGAILARIPRDRLRGRLAAGVLVVFFLFGTGLCARDCARPYHYALDEEHRTFARQFWIDGPEAVTICAQADLGREFWRNGCDSYYRCNQKIYSPPHHAGRRMPAEDIDRNQQPVRVVVFRPPETVLDEEALADCLDQTFRNYEPVDRTLHAMPLNDDRFDKYGSYEVIRFAPRNQLSQSTTPGPHPASLRPASPGSAN
jgi:hypothetical protein